ncbi:MAG TPA: alpha/beta hydrolase [Candidatus Polarisedimenticolia bacterium]|nr:alpha/beta hydrolase [Candidatus Polarisedimenticolia bacterium]
MATFCLIHGSGQGPEGWKLLAQELEGRGHRVLTPAFDIQRTDEGAAWHADWLVESMTASQTKPSETICVAHSASGIYLPLIAEGFRPRRMVFLAALIPRPGRSVLELVRDDPSMFNPGWVGRSPNEDGVAREFVFHDCPPERIEWAMSTRILFYATRALGEPCPLKAWPTVPASYIACADDRTIAPAWQCRAAREWLGVEPVVLPGGHCPHVSRPGALADALERVADASGARG